MAVGAGMPALATKSELLKIGLAKIQSSAWMANCERVSPATWRFIRSYKARMAAALSWFRSAWAFTPVRKKRHQPVQSPSRDTASSRS